MQQRIIVLWIFFLPFALASMFSVQRVEAMYLQVPVRKDTERAALCKNSPVNHQKIRHMLTSLQELNEPEYERSCCSSRWTLYPRVCALAADLNSTIRGDALDHNERFLLRAVIDDHSGWFLPQHSWKKRAILFSGLCSLGALICAGVFCQNAYACAHQQDFAAGSFCDNAPSWNMAYTAFGVAGLACSTCLGLSFSHMRYGYNPVLTDILALKPHMLHGALLNSCPVQAVRIDLPGQVPEGEEAV